jgi:hypothetical protein
LPPSIPERELGIEDIISLTMKLYMSRFTIFFGAFLAASLPGTILAAILLAPFLEYFNSYMSSQTLVTYPSIPPFDFTLIPIIILIAILSGLLLLFANGFTIVVSSFLMKGAK